MTGVQLDARFLQFLNQTFQTFNDNPRFVLRKWPFDDTSSSVHMYGMRLCLPEAEQEDSGESLPAFLETLSTGRWAVQTSVFPNMNPQIINVIFRFTSIGEDFPKEEGISENNFWTIGNHSPGGIVWETSRLNTPDAAPSQESA